MKNCDEYCANYGCNQGKNCPARSTKKPMDTVEFISKVAIAVALIVTWAYLFAECMV